jgi:hypothetical protein
MLKKMASVVALVVCLLAAWIYEEHRRADSVRPSAGATNLMAFLERHPQPNKIRKFIQNGKVHVEVLGKPIMSPLSVPSGPPAYIFDDTGALVDWAADRGENSRYVSKWGSLSNATFITIDEARRLAKPHDR